MTNNELQANRGGGNRASNIELLRIVAMSMIVLSHFLWFGVTEESIPLAIFYFIVPFLACGVNLFFMISGWFQIRCSFRSIFKLAITLLLFAFFNRLITFPFVDINTWNGIFKVMFFPISDSSYWFIKVYLFLIITSPLINLGISQMSLSALRRFMALFVFFTVYSCGIGGNICNTNFCYLQGALMYCLGYYLKRDYALFSFVSKTKAIAAAIILLTICGTGSATVRILGIFATYNSIMIIAASVIIFYIFTKMKLQSRAVNLVASSALGCYLLQDGYFGWHFMYDWMHKIFISDNPLIIRLFIYSCVFIGIWMVSLAVSPIFNSISIKLTNMLENCLPTRIVSLFNFK